MLKNAIRLSAIVDELMRNKKKVFIRGGGIAGSKVKRECDELGIEISGFLDADKAKIGTTYCDVAVFHPEHVESISKERLFIICALSEDRDYWQAALEMDIAGLIKNTHYADFGNYRRLELVENESICLEPLWTNSREAVTYFIKKENDFIDAYCNNPKWNYCHEIEDRENVLIQQLNVSLCTNCTLNCHRCCVGTFLVKEQKTYEYSEVLKDLDKFLACVSLHVLVLIGGEPFIYPQLEQLLTNLPFLTHRKNIMNIRLVTNGTVLPTENIMRLIKDNDIHVCITNYGKLSKHKNDIIKLCLKYDVPHALIPEYNGWFDYGDFSIAEELTTEQLKQKFTSCIQAINCSQMRDGKIWLCPTMEAYQEQGLIPLNENEYLDIRKTPEWELKVKIEELFYETYYLDSCKYCNAVSHGGKKVSPALQLPR